MKQFANSVTVVLIVLTYCHNALGIGGTHPKGVIGKVHPDWPDGLVKLINYDGRVHGHWVNANDEFFYRGDNAAFHRFMKQYSGLEGTPLMVTVHAGSTRRSALWGSKPEIAYDWKVLIERRRGRAPLDVAAPKRAAGYAVTVDVWLDGGVDLETLEVPVKVEAKPATEVDKSISEFIRKHEARRKKAQHESNRD
jgi:hypothetical protein